MSPIYPNLEDLVNGVNVNETRNSSMNLDSEVVVSFQWVTPILAGIAVLLNLLTFGRIIYYYVFGCQMESSASKAKIKSNAILFLQTILQDCTNLVDMISMVVLSDLFHTRFWSFTTWTFVWLNVHTIDGLVMLIFTDYKYLLKTFCCMKLCPRRLDRVQSKVPTVSVQLNSMAGDK
ncbi:hypothetical protein WR25_26953 [Diploscapter pachys]|uniref:7TM GPCR serpentine receptor class x (Srx) domain-containing protein n=1 Tax=Diploscapter pachys TaxID=2018661 RepID=A0A2A2LNJ9_9BILA|nr:hypothetical protein WR25_26953 [Diploscapter pachys]